MRTPTPRGRATLAVHAARRATPGSDALALAALTGALSDVDGIAATLAAAVAPEGVDPEDLHGAACDVPGGCYAHDQARALVASIVGTGDGQ